MTSFRSPSMCAESFTRSTPENTVNENAQRASSTQRSTLPQACPHTAAATTPTLASLRAQRWTTLRGVKPNSIAMRAAFEPLDRGEDGLHRRASVAVGLRRPEPADVLDDVPGELLGRFVGRRGEPCGNPVHRREGEAGHRRPRNRRRTREGLEGEEEADDGGEVHVAVHERRPPSSCPGARACRARSSPSRGCRPS